MKSDDDRNVLKMPQRLCPTWMYSTWTALDFATVHMDAMRLVSTNSIGRDFDGAEIN